MLTTDQIKKTVSDYFKDKPVKKVYLFGSYARGEASEESDVDLLVDIDERERIGWEYFVWYEDLEKLFTKKTDVVSNVAKPEQTSNWRLIERINKEKVLLYEKA
jgi:predicted nucleotidyltransferase